MNLNVRSQNCCFPLRSLPTVVIYHVTRYLNTRELQNMAQVDRYFRQVFNSPQLWKGVNIRLFVRPHRVRKIDAQVLEILKVRSITELSILDFGSILQELELSLPHLERLSFHETTFHILLGLYKAASSGHLNHLKEIDFGYIISEEIYKNSNKSTEVTFVDLFKCLPRIEEVSFVGLCDVLSNEGHYPVGVDLQHALCCTGKLTSISLTEFDFADKSWLNTVMINNPHLQKVSFCNIGSFGGEGLCDPSLCSRLRTFELRRYVNMMNGIAEEDRTNNVISWAFPRSIKPNKNLTSLVVTHAKSSMVFPLLDKFPALRKLNLAYLRVPRGFSLQSFPSFQNLEWLELMDSRNIWGDHLLVLSDKVGKTLHYLGLARQQQITDNDLRDLPHMFPVLRTLVLSQCRLITDGLLVEWYVKHNKNEWPKLRKLDLKNCFGITKEVVESVRLKTRNQLLIDWQL